MDGYLPMRPEVAFTMSVTSGAPIAATLPIPQGTGETTYLFDNSSNSARAWVGFGPTSTAAVSNAAVVVAGGVSPNAIPIGGGSIQTFTLQAGVFFAATLESNLGTIPALAGYGG